MLSYDPNLRPTVNQIKNHPWMRQAYNLTEIRMDILDAVSLKNEPEL